MRKLLIILVILCVAVTANAFRISRPDTYSLPWTQNTINRLNTDLESIWNLQNGEFNFDIQTTTKSGAGNGDMWFIQTGNIIRLQFKANGHIFTISPDGY